MLNAGFIITSVARKLWKFCTSPTFRATDTNSKTALRLNRFENSKNIFSYINSIKISLTESRRLYLTMSTPSMRLKQRLKSLPTAKYAIDSFHKPLKLDVTNKNEVLLVNVR